VLLHEAQRVRLEFSGEVLQVALEIFRQLLLELGGNHLKLWSKGSERLAKITNRRGRVAWSRCGSSRSYQETQNLLVMESNDSDGFHNISVARDGDEITVFVVVVEFEDG